MADKNMPEEVASALAVWQNSQKRYSEVMIAMTRLFERKVIVEKDYEKALINYKECLVEKFIGWTDQEDLDRTRTLLDSVSRELNELKLIESEIKVYFNDWQKRADSTCNEAQVVNNWRKSQIYIE